MKSLIPCIAGLSAYIGMFMGLTLSESSFDAVLIGIALLIPATLGFMIGREYT